MKRCSYAALLFIAAIVFGCAGPARMATRETTYNIDEPQAIVTARFEIIPAEERGEGNSLEIRATLEFDDVADPGLLSHKARKEAQETADQIASGQLGMAVMSHDFAINGLREVLFFYGDSLKSHAYLQETRGDYMGAAEAFEQCARGTGDNYLLAVAGKYYVFAAEKQGVEGGYRKGRLLLREALENDEGLYQGQLFHVPYAASLIHTGSEAQGRRLLAEIGVISFSENEADEDLKARYLLWYSVP